MFQYRGESEISQVRVNKSPSSNQDESNTVSSSNVQFNIGNSHSGNLLKRIRLKRILKKAIGRFKNLIVLRNIDDESVKEEWERQQCEIGQEERGDNYLFMHMSPFYYASQFVLVLFTALIVWCWSIHSVFGLHLNFMPVQDLYVLATLIDMVFSLNTIRVENGREIRQRKALLQKYVKGKIYIDCATIFVMILHKFLQLSGSIDFIVLVLTLIKLYQYTQNLRPFIDGNFSKHHTSLVRCFFLVIYTGHIFGLIFFSASKIQPNNNWTIPVGIHDESWDTQYIYSVYWAVTTIVTVGYGDITPTNKYEVLIVIVLQIVGTSIFGYMINVIGVTLAEMRKKQESLNSELAVADKLCKYFSVNTDLSYRMKNFLSDNYKVDKSFSLAEEAKIMEKLNPVLRNEILKETNSKVIRKSLFFLMNFTLQVQNYLSMKLIKRVVQPKEVLSAQDSIFIIDKGELDIQIVRYNRCRVYTKYIKTIGTAKGAHEIRHNVYGYTAMITGCKVNIKATSRSFIIAFELKKKDLQECINNSQEDYQTLCELKDDFIELENLEAIEVPQLTDSRKHYQPNKLMLAILSQKSRNQIRRKSGQCRSRVRFEPLQLIGMNININSQDGFNSIPEEQCYIRTKSSLLALTQSFTHQVTNLGVNNVHTVNNIQDPFQLKLDDPVRRVTQTFCLTDMIKSYENYRVQGNFDAMKEKAKPKKKIHRKRQGLLNVLVSPYININS